MLVVLGVFDFGLMFQRFEVVTNAAREGAGLPCCRTTRTRIRLRSRRELPRVRRNHRDGGEHRGVHGRGVCRPDLRLGAGRAETITTTPPKDVSSMKVTVTYDHEHVFVGPIMTLFGGSLGTTRLTAVSRMRKEAS